jgi:succinate-semialdehyde dehydrogenase/glutarate-semialdehyde dehydrogenase/aspartate-semialdehyde dehydrogenase
MNLSRDADGLAEKALAALRRPDLLECRSYVAGAWVRGEATAPVVDPACGQPVARVAQCDAGWIDRAVDAAAAAFESWRGTLAFERGARLRDWAALIRRHADDLATLIVAEQGKPLKEARGEIAYGAGFLDWFAAEGERAYGETIPAHKPGSHLSVMLQPVGVAAAITPWNFPHAMITRKAGAALAAGCPVIVKPAPETPLSALALARLAAEAGLPGGVFQVVTGDAAALAARLMGDARVRALSFTGSTEIGRLLMKQSAASIRKVSLELGGHAPFIVFDDAPLAHAVAGCLAAKFATSGQDCLAANRIYVRRGIYEEFLQRFGEAVSRLRVGHGLEPGTDVGPMTRASVVEKCRGHVADALANGARLVAGMQDCALGGNFVRPTVLADVADDMLIAREETFGPIAAVLPFDDEAEVVRRANASEMGLAAYVYTTELNRVMRLTERLEYGMVGVNTASFTGPPIPFGGWKQSGLGREGSRHGMAEFMELKYVCIGNLAA